MRKLFGVIFSLLATALITLCVSLLILIPVFSDLSSSEVIDRAANASVDLTEKQAGITFTDAQRAAAVEAAAKAIRTVTDSFSDEITLSDFTGISEIEFLNPLLTSSIQVVLAIVILVCAALLILANRKIYPLFAWGGTGTLLAGVAAAVLSALIGSGFFAEMDGTVGLLLDAAADNAVALLQQGATIAVCVGGACLVVFAILLSVFGHKKRYDAKN